MANMARIEKIVAQLPEAERVDIEEWPPRWREIEEWIRTSYTLVAPRRLARLVEGGDN